MNNNLTRDGDSHVVGAQAHVGGVDVPGRGGDHSVVRSLQERSLRVDHLLRDGGVEDSLDRKVLDWESRKPQGTTTLKALVPVLGIQRAISDPPVAI